MKRGIAVSDLHCGSFYGLLPPDFITFENVPKLQNAGQRYLWECWLDFCTRAEDFKPDFVLVNGDCVDGLQRKNYGAELSLTNWKDQRDAAIKTLKVLRSVTRKAKWYFTQGTPYHVGNFGEAEEDLAEAMGGSKYPSVGTGKLCREVLTLDINGFILEAAHHIGFASVYTSTPLEKEIVATKLHASEIPHLQIRSHVHNYRNLEHGRGRIVTTPCWQLQTRYARKSSVHRLKPHLGGTYIQIDTKTKRSEVWAELYEVPSVEIAKL